MTNSPVLTPETRERSLTEFEICVTARREETYQHFIYFARDLAHEDAEIGILPGSVPVSLNQWWQNLSQDGLNLDLTEAFFTANPDDTVLSSKTTLENHIHLAYLDGKSRVHWILHCRNESKADNYFVIPALPLFNSVKNRWKGHCSDNEGTPIVRIPCGERHINYFRHNLYQSFADRIISFVDRIISYEQLLTNLRNDLQNHNLDFAEIEFADSGRSMQVQN